jgi:hypothetical protein
VSLIKTRSREHSTTPKASPVKNPMDYICKSTTHNSRERVQRQRERGAEEEKRRKRESGGFRDRFNRLQPSGSS